MADIPQLPITELTATELDLGRGRQHVEEFKDIVKFLKDVVAVKINTVITTVNSLVSGLTASVAAAITAADIPGAATTAVGAAVTAADVPGVIDAALAAKDIGVWVAAPAAANSTGVKGQMATDGTYIYKCTATDTWERAALAFATWT